MSRYGTMKTNTGVQTDMADALNAFLRQLVDISSVCLELTAIIVMLYSAINSLLLWIREKEVGVSLEKGISTALEFLMCGEVLKTTIAYDVEDYISLACIIALRAALGFEASMEMRHKKKENGIMNEGSDEKTSVMK